MILKTILKTQSGTIIIKSSFTIKSLLLKITITIKIILLNSITTKFLLL